MDRPSKRLWLDRLTSWVELYTFGHLPHLASLDRLASWVELCKFGYLTQLSVSALACIGGAATIEVGNPKTCLFVCLVR
jgi:hypothetical protein